MRNRSRLAVAGAALACAAALLAAEPEAGDVVQTTRDTLARWVETQQIISRERQEWQLAREVLEQRIGLVGGEIAALEAQIDEARSSAEDAGTRRREMTAGNTALKAASSELSAVIAQLEGKVGALAAALPDPLQERVAPLTSRLPKDPDATGLTLAERFQNVIGVLNEVNKFNANVTLTRELRELPGGSKSEVRVLYVGLGQGYYVAPGGGAAGVGRPGPDGWSWTAADDLAEPIAHAIAILENEEVPAYVPLPVEVR